MRLERKNIDQLNEDGLSAHRNRLQFIQNEWAGTEDIIKRLEQFQVAIPSWALGTGGTRFGRFPGGGEPRNLEEKLEDIGLLHALNRSGGAVSL
ncbi:MAG: sugar isomerase, partial [Bacteroidota bacterium]|nr:sugar isomerase [Bacteroidota bacterium]